MINVGVILAHGPDARQSVLAQMNGDTCLRADTQEQVPDVLVVFYERERDYIAAGAVEVTAG